MEKEAYLQWSFRLNNRENKRETGLLTDIRSPVSVSWKGLSIFMDLSKVISA